MDGHKNEGAKKEKVFQSHIYCYLCLESECKMVSNVCL